MVGDPMSKIGVAEPLAGPGDTVADPTAWSYLRDVQAGELLSGDYVRLGALTEVPKLPKFRLTDTVVVDAEDVPRMAPLIPNAFERVLSNRHALENFLENPSAAKAEIRELYVS